MIKQKCPAKNINNNAKRRMPQHMNQTQGIHQSVPNGNSQNTQNKGTPPSMPNNNNQNAQNSGTLPSIPNNGQTQQSTT